ncbi:hypothetical protein [Streptomyces sp. NBC_00091]|uniref:hypothetical protein n=1 Tax=Streptomyces sp. NBC_00091 TaxID=2975648 RepID=UPI00224EE1A3|nr:hypothetical protein [Streptomyces sp. NBC_00091]MCX5380353.1 hypothetical protein [Streptomyces sp. NBC_00091]
MDPAVVVTAVMAAVGYLARLLYRWVKERAEVKKTELAQTGLSDRVRLLPAGSKLIERDGARSVEITVGSAGQSGSR